MSAWFATLVLVGCSNGGGGSGASGGSSDSGINLDTGSGADDQGTVDSGHESGGTSASDDGSDQSESGFNNSCGESMFVLDAVPPNVVLVLDKSGSMVSQQWDADGDVGTPDVTRWESLHNVVSFVVDSFDTEINFGAVMFPSTDARSEFSAAGCAMSDEPEVPVAGMNADGVLGAIPAADADNGEIGGGTPAASGVRLALSHLQTLDPTVDRFMILVTDGAANCSDEYPDCGGIGCDMFEQYDDDLPLVVAQALSEDDISTFVVGIDIQDATVGAGNDGQPEVNTFEKLNEVAVAGGRALEQTERFFNAQNEAELQSALAAIAGQVVSCRIPLNPEPLQPGFVEIEVDGEMIERVDDCETESGWVYVNPEGPYDAIELCNAACGSLAENGQLDALYGCPPAQ